MFVLRVIINFWIIFCVFNRFVFFSLIFFFCMFVCVSLINFKYLLYSISVNFFGEVVWIVFCWYVWYGLFVVINVYFFLIKILW